MDYVEEIEIDTTSNSNDEWKKIMSEELKKASCFEIHCWNEELEEIEMALQYGELKEKNWKYGKVIAGMVTKRFVDYLLSITKPTDTNIYNPELFTEQLLESKH